MNRLPILFALILGPGLLVAQTSKSPLKLNGLYRDNMVLQQKSQASIRGRATPGQTVSVTGSWNQETLRAVADTQGKWTALLQTPEAGGPHTLEVKSGAEKITLKNVLSGEVWICSGQSNMQWRLRGFGPDHWAEEVAKADFPAIRYCYVPQTMAFTPQDDLKCSWSICTPKMAPGYSAIAYFFGSKLHQELKVPIGLISTNWGGSTAEAWISPEVLGKKFPEFKEPLARNARHQDELPDTFPKAKTLPKGINQQAPSLLYHSMIHPLIPFKIKGVIWYQGESNVKSPEQYRTLFPALIQNWRSEWNQGDFPFYFVQIAPFAYKTNPMSAAFLREAQTMALSEPNTGMVVTMDLGNPSNIHPKKKKPVAERLANLALANDYGQKNLTTRGPHYRNLEITGSKAHLNFEHTGSGLTASDHKPLSHFTIAGPDQIFHPAKATIKGDQIIVESEKVTQPAAVRFAWGSGDEPNLANREGLPASSFRTDSWPITTK